MMVPQLMVSNVGVQQLDQIITKLVVIGGISRDVDERSPFTTTA